MPDTSLTPESLQEAVISLDQRGLIEGDTAYRAVSSYFLAFGSLTQDYMVAQPEVSHRAHATAALVSIILSTGQVASTDALVNLVTAYTAIMQNPGTFPVVPKANDTNGTNLESV